MNDVTTGEQVQRTLEGMSPAAETRVARRLNVLLGVVPLWELTQAETDWVFRQKVRLADV
ncbi:MAG TPA: hypothetical protein VD866_09545 [Urbifossiella sp.]|nr:hypothetical protein [Urbifossiella sp.]